jgi:hypothetical protein
MRTIALVTEVGSLKSILEHLSEPATPPPIASARGPSGREEDFSPSEGTEGTDLSEPLPDFEFDQRLSR